MSNSIKEILRGYENKRFIEIVFFLKDYTYHSAYKNYLEIPTNLANSLNKEELEVLKKLVGKIKNDSNKEGYLSQINSILISQYIKKSDPNLENEAEQILSEISDVVSEEDKIRNYIKTRFSRASVSRIIIERTLKQITINITSGRPKTIIGKSNQIIDRLKEDLKNLTGKEVQINIFEIIRPELDAKLVSASIARQIENRISYRRAIKMAIAAAMRMSAKGIKVQISGRLNGAETARSEFFKEGRIALSTFRSDIDYAKSDANTTYGRISIKVWIMKGEVSKSAGLKSSFAKKVGASGFQSKTENEIVLREIKLPNNITIKVVTDENNSNEYKFGNPAITNKALDLIIREYNNKGLK